MMSLFRIAHLTDLHFGKHLDWSNPLESTSSPMKASAEAIRQIVKHGFGGVRKVFYPSTFNPSAAYAVLEWLAAELHDLDAILVTGDLATTGEAADLQLAADFFGGQAPPTWSPKPLPVSLLESEIDIVTMPGNHDRYEQFFQPSKGMFEGVFGKHWDFDKERLFPFLDPVKDSGRVKFITWETDEAYLGVFCADFSLESASNGTGSAGFIGQGSVSFQVIKELEWGVTNARAEAEESKKPIGIIWAVHFPPDFPNIQDSLKLIGSDLLVEAATKANVEFIICGHTHESLMYKLKSDFGEVQVLCSGPTTGVSSHGRYSASILDIDVSSTGSVALVPSLYTWDQFAFKPQATFPNHP